MMLADRHVTSPVFSSSINFWVFYSVLPSLYIVDLDSGVRFSQTSIADVRVVLMASVTHKPASLCTMFRSLITPDCWVFGHHPTDPLVVMGRITLVYNYRVIFEFSIQFFSPRFLHLPMIIVVLLVIFWMYVPDEFLVEDNLQVFCFFAHWDF